jgi:hypothetical protein
MPGLPRKSTKNQFTKLLKKSGKSKTNTEAGATAVTKNISTVERKILKYKQFINENMNYLKKYELIKEGNFYKLIFKGSKNIIYLIECQLDKDYNNYNNWSPCNINKKSGYAWVFNQMRPYGKYVKFGLLKGSGNNEFSVDLVSIKEGHFDNGYKDWIECEKCKGKGCKLCDHQGSVASNVVKTDYVDHIVVMKRTTYDKDCNLAEHTILNINDEIKKII